jgi:phage tail-like protein
MTDGTVIRPRDPLRNFQFRLRLLPVAAGPTETGPASDYIAGVKSVTGLSVSVAAIEIWSGGNNRHRHAHPDKCTWEPITLTQGLARDNTLSAWAQAAVIFATTGAAPAGQPVKRNVVLDVWNPYSDTPPEQGSDPPAGTVVPLQPSYRFVIHNAWISRYEAMPVLDAMANEIALMSVELTHEGWQEQIVDLFATPGNGDEDPLYQPGASDLYQEPGPDTPMLA